MIQKTLLFVFAFMMGSVGQASVTTTAQKVAIQETILLNQKDVLIAAGAAVNTAGSPLAIQVYNNHVPFVFQNNTGLPASQVYVTFQGIDAANPGSQQFLKFDTTTAFGTFVTPSSNLLSANYSVQLSSMPQVQNFPGSYLFYVPLTISGRAYVSFGQPMFLPVSTSSPYSVLDPYVTQYTDPNYYTIYDKWEFTFNTSGQSAPNLAWQGNINTSGVDFFGISSEISFLSYPSGSLLQTFDSTQVNDGPTSFNKQRDTLLTTFVNGLTTTSPNGQYWGALCLPFLSNPYNGASPVTTYLRILNPGFSIQNPPSSYAGMVAFPQNPSAGFPSDYLQNAGLYGENYIDEWFTYYNTTGGMNTLSIYQDVLAAPFTYSGNSSGMSMSQSFSLTASGGQPTEILDETGVTTTPFFTGAAFPFMPANSILSQYVGATFEVGLFNNTTVPTISQATLRANSGSYYANPAFTTTPGPWYDLYASLLHSQGVVPSYSATGVGAVYASPYDDLLGINSSIAVKNPTNYTVVPSPYVNITLNGGNVIPSIEDFGNLTLIFDLSGAPMGSSISYRTGTSGPYIPYTAPVAISTYPLQVEYVSGISGTRYYTIYLRYQNIQPTVFKGNQYNSADQGIISTTTIYPNVGLDTYTVSFVQ